jgi:hypothetical protein
MPKQERGPFNFIEKEDKTKEGEISLKKKAEIIKEYIKEDYSDLTTFKKNKVKESFSKMNDSQIEELFGAKEFELLYKIISKWNFARESIRKKMPESNEIQDFVKKYGERNLPRQISLLVSDWKDLIDIDFFQYDLILPEIYDKLINGKTIEHSELKLEGRAGLIEWLIEGFKEKKTEEGLAKIIGFEKFDRPEIKGAEIVEKAATAILPRGLISDLNNLKCIEYIDKKGPPTPVPGIRSNGEYDPLAQKIIIYKTKDLLLLLPAILSHDWAHSLDPRVINQNALPMKEQFELIKKWEEIREEEPVKISFYCQSIKDEFQKSKDGWAESIRLLLTDPKELKEKSEKRYNFFLSMLKKSYPEFDPSQTIEKKKEYKKLLSDLGYESVNSALKSVETKFERLKEK